MAEKEPEKMYILLRRSCSCSYLYNIHGSKYDFNYSLAKRLMVWAINSRSPDLASESPNKSENFDIVRQLHWELSNFQKFFFIMDELYEKLIFFWGGGGVAGGKLGPIPTSLL